MAATPVAAAPPPPLGMDVTPAVPLTGQLVTFKATNPRSGDVISWDFENDGTFDATGLTVQHVYATPGARTVRMRAKKGGDSRDVLQTIRVEAPPSASFTGSPSPATVGETVVFDGGASVDLDGTIVAYRWDLDGDGDFDDASGVTASRSFFTAGAHTVGLQVTDNRGHNDTAIATVTVSNGPGPSGSRPLGAFVQSRPLGGTLGSAATGLQLMTPFPVVRMVSRRMKFGARVKLLRVGGAPRGASVTVRCRGAGCRRRRQSRQVGSASVRFRAFERGLRAGARIQIFVTQPGKIGKYTSFRIRLRRSPLRRDLCVTSVTAQPLPCPGS